MDGKAEDGRDRYESGAEPTVYADFTMNCPTCGPGTIVFKGGQQQPHACGYEPPTAVAFEVGPGGITSWPDGSPVNFAAEAEASDG